MDGLYAFLGVGARTVFLLFSVLTIIPVVVDWHLPVFLLRLLPLGHRFFFTGLFLVAVDVFSPQFEAYHLQYFLALEHCAVSEPPRLSMLYDQKIDTVRLKVPPVIDYDL